MDAEAAEAEAASAFGGTAAAAVEPGPVGYGPRGAGFGLANGKLTRSEIAEPARTPLRALACPGTRRNCPPAYRPRATCPLPGRSRSSRCRRRLQAWPALLHRPPAGRWAWLGRGRRG